MYYFRHKIFFVGGGALIAFTFFLFSPSSLYAAKFYFDAGRGSILPSDTLEIDVMVDTEGQNDNAFEGKLLYSTNLEPLEITSGESIITSWVDYPEARDGTIEFSGIVPGGFSGLLDPATKEVESGLLFTIRFAITDTTPAQISFLEVKALKNDGLAGRDTSTSEHLRILVSENAAPSFERTTLDLNPPEFFTPKIASHPSVYEGKYFLAFDTIDKGTRIRDFWVKEGNGSWQKAESPYLLKDQGLRSQIYVKAVDLDGNERIVTIEGGPYDMKWSAIVIAALILSAVIWYVRKKRK